MERLARGAVPTDPQRFRLLRRLPDSTLRRGRLELAQGQGLLWLDLTAPSEAELAWLGGRFGFHPLALEDSRSPGPAPEDRGARRPLERKVNSHG